MKYWWLWCSWRGWRSFATFHGADCLNCNATRPTWLWYVATRAVSLGPIVGVDCWIAGRDGSVCLTHRFYCLARRLAWTTRTCVSFVVSSWCIPYIIFWFGSCAILPFLSGVTGIRSRVLKNMSPAHPIFNTAMQKFPV